MRLQDNVTIITGAGQGIGEAYARAFVAEGAKVAIADINREKGEAVAEDLRKAGAEVIFVPVDVSNSRHSLGLPARARVFSSPEGGRSSLGERIPPARGRSASL